TGGRKAMWPRPTETAGSARGCSAARSAWSGSATASAYGPIPSMSGRNEEGDPHDARPSSGRAGRAAHSQGKTMRAAKKRSQRKDSIGAVMIRRLEHFASVLESGDAIEKHLTDRRVALPAAPAPWTAAEIKPVRNLLGASQIVFARILGVSPQTV